VPSPCQHGGFRSSRSSQGHLPQRRSPARRPAQRSSRSMSSVRRSATIARSAFCRTSLGFRAARRFASPRRSEARWRSTSRGSTSLPGLGHLSLDFSDGEVRYRVVQQVVPSLANEPLLIANFFDVAIHSMNAHLPFVSGVAFEGTSPEQAAQTYLRAVSAEAGYCHQLAGEQ
jgi:hypothetical protein